MPTPPIAALGQIVAGKRAFDWNASLVVQQPVGMPEENWAPNINKSQRGHDWLVRPSVCCFPGTKSGRPACIG